MILLEATLLGERIHKFEPSERKEPSKYVKHSKEIITKSKTYRWTHI
jgi:hypothetical protein